MEPAQAALPRPDHPNANNEKPAAERLSDFEKQQAYKARQHANDIIRKHSVGAKGTSEAFVDLKGMQCVPYPSIESINEPTPVDFALQGSDILFFSTRETHPSLNLQFTCPNKICGKECGNILSTDGWAPGARCCHSFDRTHYIVSRRYKCKKCEGKMQIPCSWSNFLITTPAPTFLSLSATALAFYFPLQRLKRL
jgi:hypothetical protein